MALICICAALLCIAGFITHSQCQQTKGGPHNIVVVASQEATLFCNRSISESVDIQWKYRPPGSETEQDIPSRHRSVKSNYGFQSLVLEDVQLSHAGTYVCRGVIGDLMKPAGAFLVVVAQEPCCHVDDVKSAQPSLRCSVTYAGQLDASVSLLGEDGSTLLSRNFTAQRIASTYAVSTRVPVRQAAYRCRVSFSSNHSHADVAKNQPRFVEGSCYVPFRRVQDSKVDGDDQTTDVSPADNAEHEACDNSGDNTVVYLLVAVIVLLILVLLILVTVVVSALCFVLRRQLSCSCFQSTEGDLSQSVVVFLHCCGGVANRQTSGCEANDGKQTLHVQVSPEHVENGIVAISPTEDDQLLGDGLETADTGV